MEQRVLLIMNPCAGQKRGKRYLADILCLLREHDYIPTTLMTQRRGDARELVKAYGHTADMVVCIGGDGTFNEVICGMLEAKLDLPIGYIPAGSTNDFAGSLKLPKNMLKAAEKMINGTPTSIDIGRFGDRYFSYVASFGAFTRASYATSQNFKNALGHLAYVLEGIKDIPTIRPWHVRFETEGQVMEDDYIFGAICNSTSIGGILTLAPEVVDMNDGKFELLLIKAPTTAAELNDIVVALTTQKYDYPAINFCTASNITVSAPEEMDWALDGEWEPGRKTCKVENLHSAIRLLL